MPYYVYIMSNGQGGPGDSTMVTELKAKNSFRVRKSHVFDSICTRSMRNPLF